MHAMDGVDFWWITKYITGISYMRRDGKRMGIIRSVWRAIILYAPLLIVAYLVSYCNTQGTSIFGGVLFSNESFASF